MIASLSVFAVCGPNTELIQIGQRGELAGWHTQTFWQMTAMLWDTDSPRNEQAMPFSALGLTGQHHGSLSLSV